MDPLGDFDDAMLAAAELAGLADGEYGQKLIERQLTPTEQMILDLLSIFQVTGLDPAAIVDAPTPVEVFANQLQKLVAHVGRFNDPMSVYSHCLCEMEQ